MDGGVELGAGKEGDRLDGWAYTVPSLKVLVEVYFYEHTTLKRTNGA